MKKRNLIFRWLHRIHIYGGIYAAPLFLIVGITGLEYQHHFFSKKPLTKREYTQVVHMTDTLDQKDFIDDLSDSLGFWGHKPWWEIYEDTDGQLFFKVFRPGKKYEITAFRTSDTVRVVELTMRPGHILEGLHVGTSGGPSSRVFTIWRIYAESAVLIGFIVLIISVYFWFKKSVKSKTEGWITFSIAIFSLLLILTICLEG